MKMDDPTTRAWLAVVGVIFFVLLAARLHPPQCVFNWFCISL